MKQMQILKKLKSYGLVFFFFYTISSPFQYETQTGTKDLGMLNIFYSTSDRNLFQQCQFLDVLTGRCRLNALLWLKSRFFLLKTKMKQRKEKTFCQISEVDKQTNAFRNILPFSQFVVVPPFLEDLSTNNKSSYIRSPFYSHLTSG